MQRFTKLLIGLAIYNVVLLTPFKKELTFSKHLENITSISQSKGEITFFSGGEYYQLPKEDYKYLKEGDSLDLRVYNYKGLADIIVENTIDYFK